jgi:hypothetical protein
MSEMDHIDEGMLAKVNSEPGICVRRALEPFLGERTETALRYRLRSMVIAGLIKQVKTRSEIKLFPAEV